MLGQGFQYRNDDGHKSTPNDEGWPRLFGAVPPRTPMTIGRVHNVNDGPHHNVPSVLPLEQRRSEVVIPVGTDG